MIHIKEAISKAELTDFVKFPFDLYKENQFWVPPIIVDELDTFDKTKNPVFDVTEAYFYLAYYQNKIVGRIAAIINWSEVKNQQKRKVRFGWFDVIDDIEVTKKLLEKVYELGKKNNLSHIEGPMGFSNLDKVGVLTEGYNQIGSMVTWYNYPYYVAHLEKLDFKIEKEYVETKMLFSNIKSEFFDKGQELVKNRYQLEALNFTKTKNIMPYVDEMFDLFNASYANLSSFVAISEKDKVYYKKKYISFINPEYIKFVIDKNKKMIAFSIAMPNFATALQKAKGTLFPFGFYHLLKAKSRSKEVLFYLIGVAPEYQNKGAHAILFKEMHKSFTEKGIQTCIRTPELENNVAVQLLWKNFEPKVVCRRKTYAKYL